MQYLFFAASAWSLEIVGHDPRSCDCNIAYVTVFCRPKSSSVMNTQEFDTVMVPVSERTFNV